MKFISSAQNPLVRQILLLQEKSKFRKQEGLFVCEGLNEIKLCVNGEYEIENIIFCEKNISKIELQKFTDTEDLDEKYIEVNADVFHKVAYREDVKNALAIVKAKEWTEKALVLPQNPLFLVAEKVEKPGNLGALLRTADAAGITAVLLADPLCDIYNPNVIRSSVGCVFTVPVIGGPTRQIQEYLSKNKIAVFTTFMQNAISAWQCDFSGPSALVVGTESTGLSSNWKKEEYQNINIPMFGKVDSMNVSVAASLLMFEAVRQRKMISKN